jgi:hypothetical protein
MSIFLELYKAVKKQEDEDAKAQEEKCKAEDRFLRDHFQTYNLYKQYKKDRK